MKFAIGCRLKKITATLKRKRSPGSQSAAVRVNKEGISNSTLPNWRRQIRNQYTLMSRLGTTTGRTAAAREVYKRSHSRPGAQSLRGQNKHWSRISESG